MSGVSPILDIRSLRLELGEAALLQDISFTLESGRKLAIIGPNGAGKTTLLRCIGRFMEPSSGDIVIDGSSHRTYSRRDLAKRIGYVPQAGGRMLPYSVREFIMMARYPYFQAFSGPSKNDRSAVEKAMQITGTEGFSERAVSTLSGGERQKVLIAAALAQQTPVLLLDEPTAFLDYRHEVELLELISRLNRESGLTVIVVTHDLNSGVLDSHCILGLKAGKQVFWGDPEALIQPGVLERIYGISFDLIDRPDNGRKIIVPKGSAQ
jgi:cobalamin transport system ATP-binding protein